MRVSTCLRIAVVAVVATGCQPRYDGIHVRVLTGDGELTPDHVEIEEGHAMAIEIKPLSSNPFEDYEDFNLVELESFNDNILLVAPADDVNRFVVVGAGVGTTSIDVLIDGHHEDIMDGRVVIQGAP